MLKYMLDTHIVIYVIKRRPLTLLEIFNRRAGQMCISSITLAELFHGAEKSSKPDHNMRQVEDFVSRLEVLDYGSKAAAHYGEIRTDLERKGTPIGLNDLHIAGHARSEALTLVTNNLREFELHVTFTLRFAGTLVRVISARDMHRKERTFYGQTKKDTT